MYNFYKCDSCKWTYMRIYPDHKVEIDYNCKICGHVFILLIDAEEAKVLDLISRGYKREESLYKASCFNPQLRINAIHNLLDKRLITNDNEEILMRKGVKYG